MSIEAIVNEFSAIAADPKGGQLVQITAAED